MDRLKQIKNEVAREKRGIRFDTLLYELYPDDTYVYEVDRWDIDEIMSEAARRYAQAVSEDALKRAAQQAVIEHDVMGYAYISEQSILSTEINLDL